MIRRLQGALALLPMTLVALVFAGGTVWTLLLSFTPSGTWPVWRYAGWTQYFRLLQSERWWTALWHLLQYALWFIPSALLLGTLLAVALDRKRRAATFFRGVFLYSYSVSFVAVGLAWQWLLDPQFGMRSVLLGWGWDVLPRDWLGDPATVMSALVVATVWQVSGLVMVLLLAALASIDRNLWDAARVDGIPEWRIYTQLVLPQLLPTYLTLGVLLGTLSIKLFDTVAAMTQGGPGLASDVPARFVMEHLFGRANIALASAGAISLLVLVAVFVVPWAWYQRSRRMSSP